MPEANTSIEPKTESVLFSWTAKSRPFKKRSREFYVTVISIVSVVGLIIFLVEGIMPVVLLIALVFLFYILNTVEPEDIEYKITESGVKIATNGTPWNQVVRYWFTKRLDNDILIFETAVFPGRLEMIVNKDDEDEIKKAIGEKATEEKTPPTYIDKTAEWISKKLPQS